MRERLGTAAAAAAAESFIGGSMKGAARTVGRALDGLAAGAVVAGIVTLVAVAVVAVTGQSGSVPGLLDAVAAQEGGSLAVSVNVSLAGILVLAIAGMALRLLLRPRTSPPKTTDPA